MEGMGKTKRLGKSLVWLRRIHSWIMWLAMSLGGIMIATGLSLEDDGEREVGEAVNSLAKVVHRALATPFAIVLGIMIVTGFLIWLLPKLAKQKAKYK